MKKEKEKRGHHLFQMKRENQRWRVVVVVDGGMNDGENGT